MKSPVSPPRLRQAVVRAFGLQDLVCSLLRCLDDQRFQFVRADLLGSGSKEAALENLDLVLKVQADLLEVLDLGGGFNDFGLCRLDLCFRLGRSGFSCQDPGFSLESPLLGLGQGLAELCDLFCARLLLHERSLSRKLRLKVYT